MTALQKLQFLNLRSTTPEGIETKQLHRMAQEYPDLQVIRDWLEETGQKGREPGISWYIRRKNIAGLTSSQHEILDAWFTRIVEVELDALEKKMREGQSRWDQDYCAEALSYLTDCFYKRKIPSKHTSSVIQAITRAAEALCIFLNFLRNKAIHKNDYYLLSFHLDRLDELEAVHLLETIQNKFNARKRWQ